MIRSLPAILLVGLLFLGCDTGVIDLDKEPQGIVTRTLYATDRIEMGFTLSESPDGDIYVAGFGDGRLGVLDDIHGKPLILRIRSNGSIADTMIVGEFDDGKVVGVVPIGDGIAALIQHYELIDGWKLENRNLSLFRVGRDGLIAELLHDFGKGTARRIVRTDDSDIVAILEQSEPSEYELVKMAPDGKRIWAYRMPGIESVSRADEGPNGHIYVLGELSGSRFQMSRISSDGNELWNRTYENDTSSRHSLKIAVGKSRIVMIGRSSTPNYTQHIFISSFSLDGELVWEQEYVTGNDHLSSNAIVALPNGDIMFAWSVIENTGYKTLCEIVRLSGEGDVIWRRAFEAEYDTATVSDMFVAIDDRLIILGEVGPSGYYYESDIVVWQLDF